MKQKIVLIDDDPMIIDLYSKTLGQEFEVITSQTGEEGLRLIEKDNPDLVLTDIMLPDITGLAVVEHLKSKGLLHVPVLVLTNFAKDDKIARAIEMGAQEYILKHEITPHELLEKVRGILEK